MILQPSSVCTDSTIHLGCSVTIIAGRQARYLDPLANCYVVGLHDIV